MAEQDPLVADNPERPEWLPEKFESPEDLARSYAEAERRITEVSQSAAEERRAREAVEESLQQLSSQFEEFTAAQTRPDPQNVLSQWQDQYENDPFNTTLTLSRQVAQETVQEILRQQGQAAPPISTADMTDFAAERIGRQYGDFEELRPLVAEELQKNPLFARDDLYSSVQSTTSAFENAYHLVKARQVLDGSAVVDQQQADTRAMKLAAQTASGAAGRPPAPSDDAAEWERIKNAAPKRYYE